VAPFNSLPMATGRVQSGSINVATDRPYCNYAVIDQFNKYCVLTLFLILILILSLTLTIIITLILAITLTRAITLVQHPHIRWSAVHDCLLLTVSYWCIIATVTLKWTIFATFAFEKQCDLETRVSSLKVIGYGTIP